MAFEPAFLAGFVVCPTDKPARKPARGSSTLDPYLARLTESPWCRGRACSTRKGPDRPPHIPAQRSIGAIPLNLLLIQFDTQARPLMRLRPAARDEKRFCQQVVHIKQWTDNVAGELIGCDARSCQCQMNHRGAADSHLEIASRRTPERRGFRDRGDLASGPDPGRFADVDRE